MSDLSGRVASLDAIGPVAPPVRRVTFRAKLLREAEHIAGMLIYLWVFFGLLALSQFVALSSLHIEYRFYGAAMINALLLVKVVVLAEDFGFARRFDDGPLITAILYKSMAFAVLLIVFYLTEEIAIGAWQGKTIAESAPRFGTSIGGISAATAMMFIGLMPYFAYAGIGRVLGSQALHRLLLKRHPKVGSGPAKPSGGPG